MDSTRCYLYALITIIGLWAVGCSNTELETTTLSRSEKRGLLDVPLPQGAVLVDSTEGNPAEGRDPRERYRIDASAEEIISFYRSVMQAEGWAITPPTSATSVFFQKGDKMIGVLTNTDGGTFTLMGS